MIVYLLVVWELTAVVVTTCSNRVDHVPVDPTICVVRTYVSYEGNQQKSTWMFFTRTYLVSL